VRYLTDGYLDPSFNGKGYTRIAFDGLLYCSAFTIDLLPNGKMIVGGLGYNQAVNGQLNMHRCIARLTASGIPDNAFNGNGMVIVDSLQRPAIGSNWAPPCLKLQADGKILLSTTSGSLPYNEYFSLLRLDTAGMPDYAFGDRGRVITDVTPSEDLPYDIAVQGDGKILLCGVADQDTAWPQSLHSAPAIVRYLPNINLGIPPPDTSFADMQVYPNPAREALTLSYSINKGSAVSVQLRNIQGQLVQRWMDSERRTAGNHKEVLPLSEALAAGTYILSVAVDGAQHAFLITRQ
jgi:uncharacterized delta-60 repeat protein